MLLRLQHHPSCGCGNCSGGFSEDASADPEGGSTAENGKTILTPSDAATNLVRSGLTWYLNNYGVLDDGIINYGFWASYEELASSYYVSVDGSNALEEVEKRDKFSVFSGEQIAVAEKALGLWDDLISIRFERTTAADGDINFGNTQSAPGSGAYAYFPFGDIYDQKHRDEYGFAQIGRVGGDVWVNSFISANQGPSANGSYMLLAMIHEVGHSLGLSHTGVYNASQDSDGDGQPDPITYETHAKFFQDSFQYSVMSYFRAEKTGASHLNWQTLKFVLPSTPMVHDVLAMQKIYGADTSTRTGDTIYGFNSNAGRDAFDFTITSLPVVTIWDGGGVDTLDFSGWNTKSLINLNEGQFSSGGGTGFLKLDELKARGILPSSYTEEQYVALKAKYNSTDGLLKDNIAIAYGTVVENAIGGGGDDIIIGNGVANHLVGGAGRDALTGGAANDILDGGEGTDTADYSAETGAGSVTVNLGDGSVFGLQGLVLKPRQARDSHGDLDILISIENVKTDAGDDSVYGSAVSNMVETGAGNDRFFLQQGGDDIAFGGGGNDIFYYGAALTSGDRSDGGEGKDAVLLQGDYSTGLALGENSLVEVEGLLFASGSDTRWGDVAGNSYSYNVTTTDANIAAGAKLTVNGSLLRQGENLTFNGSAEKDGFFFIYGGKGTDDLTGGEKNDIFFFADGARWSTGDKINGGVGFDGMILRGIYSGETKVVFGSNDLISIEAIGLNSVSDFRFDPGLGTFSYDITLSEGNVGETGKLIINGFQLNKDELMVVNGSAVETGSLNIYGGAGNDVISGGAGADVLRGNAGGDILEGGAGADTFQYFAPSDTAVDNPDEILDFEIGIDRIDLSRLDANSTADGNQAFSFIGAAAFSGSGAASAGQLRAYDSDGKWFIEGDVDGDGAADFLIQVNATTPEPLSGADFVF